MARRPAWSRRSPSVHLRTREEGSAVTEGDAVSKQQILAEKLRKRRERKERMKKFRAIKKARRAARETSAKFSVATAETPVPSSVKPAVTSLRAGTKAPQIVKTPVAKSAAAPTPGEVDKLKQRAIDALERDVADLSRLSAPSGEQSVEIERIRKEVEELKREFYIHLGAWQRL